MPFGKDYGSKPRGKGYGGSTEAGRQKANHSPKEGKKPAGGAKTGGPSFENARPGSSEARAKKKENSWERPSYSDHNKRQPRANNRSVADEKFAAKDARPKVFSNENAVDRLPTNLLVGRNPVREALKSGRDIEKLMIAKGELSGSAREIIALARDASIVVQTVDRAHLSELAPNHQGMIAVASAFRYAALEDIFEKAAQKNEAPLIVVLDGITDPHNVGAIIRNAECAGAHGVVIQNRRAAGLTPAAVKASAGAVEHLPVARVTNISKCLETLKARGLWAIAADMAGQPYQAADLTGPVALVIGAEGDGISRLVLSGCDKRVALPVHGKIDSLNASVACGILLYEIRRQRG